MDQLWKYTSEKLVSKKPCMIWFHLYEISAMSKSRDREQISVAGRLREDGGITAFLSMGSRGDVRVRGFDTHLWLLIPVSWTCRPWKQSWWTKWLGSSHPWGRHQMSSLGCSHGWHRYLGSEWVNVSSLICLSCLLKKNNDLAIF